MFIERQYSMTFARQKSNIYLAFLGNDVWSSVQKPYLLEQVGKSNPYQNVYCD